MKQRILLVEDDELIGEMVRLNLEQEGYEVIWFKQGEGVGAKLADERFDLIVLDIMLPGKDGFTVLGELRAAEVGTPTLVLTALAESGDKVTGLDLGADDYLTKPFEMEEFLARVRALIRRSQGQRELPARQHLRIGRYNVNLETREADTSEGRLTLSEKEAELVRLFARNAGTTLTRADILDEVWGMDATPTERTVDNFLVRLRKLFEEDPDKPAHFITVRARGYRFEP